jgi:hypothetical protein
MMMMIVINNNNNISRFKARDTLFKHFKSQFGTLNLLFMLNGDFEI